MTDKNLLLAMGHIDPKLIAEASPDVPYKKKASNKWVRWGAVAACLASILAMILVRPSSDNEVTLAVVDNSVVFVLISVLLMSLLLLILTLIKRNIPFKRLSILYAISFVAINVSLILLVCFGNIIAIGGLPKILISSNLGILLLLGSFTLFTHKTKIRWKKVLIWLVVFAVSITMTACYAAGAFDKYDPSTWFDTASTRGISNRKTEKITVGMTLEEVVDILGKPQRDTGSGVIVMEWDMKSGQIFVVAFNSDIDDNFDREWISFHIEIRDKS